LRCYSKGVTVPATLTHIHAGAGEHADLIVGHIKVTSPHEVKNGDHLQIYVCAPEAGAYTRPLFSST